MKTLMFIFAGILFFSFGEKKVPNPGIIGHWVLGNYQVETAVYHRRSDFDKDKAGIWFQDNGKIVKRQNSGWCGTPPITYKNYDGTWEQTSDSTLVIRYKFWGGNAEEEWLITYMDKNILKINSLSYKNDRNKEWQVEEPEH
ncbi:MAG: hypothetical protein K0R65_1346 [Crocinitomicaceae bacterium]|jgi:hypothetical protein|nr:hypothetical protein [Crocinitomicaceae bacterium]